MTKIQARVWEWDPYNRTRGSFYEAGLSAATTHIE